MVHQFLDVRRGLFNSKHAKKTQPVAQRKVELEPVEVFGLYADFCTWNPELAERVTEEVLKRALKLIKFRIPHRNLILLLATATEYIEAALHYCEISGRTIPNGVYTPEILGWNVDLLQPLVDIGHDPNGPRHPSFGTPPYASAKILNVEPVRVDRWQTNLPPSEVIPDAIHDMESFYWVLLYLSMTHSGPGGVRREELVGELDADSSEAFELRTICHCFFDGPLEKIAWNKREAFRDYKSFEPLVLRHAHPYFEPLRPLLRRWWELLLLAYEFEGWEYHHNYGLVIKLLERALEEPENVESSDDEQHQQDAQQKRDDFFDKRIDSDTGIAPSQAQQVSALSSHDEHQVKTAFLGTPEAENPKLVSHVRDMASSPLSPTPIPNKSRRIDDSE
ncbi:hypothetical protein PYCCODRAFT_1462498 [Trametes coccinea BRFM310]|uniref:Fungal-type protein kinase domain-containing protein n=1 Tax=Trametes coccinea (strain BRFM310) TaxID=1353009 RepID=A0A1Y2J478_TRAC3|nr:hypothetical protein PYCCODRAFT_1462498 [Trametes coccinea BRFM310]